MVSTFSCPPRIMVLAKVELKQAHVEHCGLHTLRHTFASKLFAATNGNAKLVSELVRHSSVSFTEDIYIHLIEQTKANVLEGFSI